MAETGATRCAACTEPLNARSHPQAARRARRASAVSGDRAARATSVQGPAIWCASQASSASSARSAGGEQTTMPHSERNCRAPRESLPKCVCSRSRPAVSATAAASSWRASSLRAATPGARLPRACRKCRAAWPSASREVRRAWPHAVSGGLVRDSMPPGTAAMSCR